MPAAIGVQLAQPSRPVVCVIGEGSAQYAIQSLWTAAAYEVPVTFLVLRNDEYAILKWFGMLEDIVGAPGLDLPALDCGGRRTRLRGEFARGRRRRGAGRRAEQGARLG